MSEGAGGVYFPVRAGFCRDRAARALRRAHGWSGMGRYVGLLCMLLEEPGHVLDVSTADGLADLAEQWGCAADEAASLLSDMASAGLVDPDGLGDGVVRADAVEESIKARDEFSERMRAAGRKGAEARWGRKKAGP